MPILPMTEHSAGLPKLLYNEPNIDSFTMELVMPIEDG